MQEEAEEVGDAKLQRKQYEQPGELVTLASGLQYRELLPGSGRAAALGDTVSLRYALHLAVSQGVLLCLSPMQCPHRMQQEARGTRGMVSSPSLR